MFNKTLLESVTGTPWDPLGNDSLTGELFPTPQVISLPTTTSNDSLQGGVQFRDPTPTTATQATTTPAPSPTITIPSQAATQIERQATATQKRRHEKNNFTLC